MFYGKLAEIVGMYVRKGQMIYVEGSLRTRKWQGQDGQERYTTEIIASDMQMLGGRPNDGERAPMNQGAILPTLLPLHAIITSLIITIHNLLQIIHLLVDAIILKILTTTYHSKNTYF